MHPWSMEEVEMQKKDINLKVYNLREWYPEGKGRGVLGMQQKVGTKYRC